MFCIAGKNKIAVEALYFMLNNGVSKENIVACVGKMDTGIHKWQPSFRAICESNGITICELADLYTIKDLMFFSTQFDKIIKPSLFLSANLFNVHFSRLPAYKGLYTSILPILYNEEYGGVTMHKIDAGIDTGDIIDQVSFKIPTEADSYDLYNLSLNHGIELFRKNFNKIISGDYIATAQMSEQSTYYSKATIDFSNLHIDLNRSAFQIKNQIRAFTFRPFQLLKFGNVPIVFAKIETNRSTGKPGRILDEDENSFLVSSVDFNVRLFKDKLDVLLDAAKQGDLAKLDILHSIGYKLNEKNEHGWDALIVSSYYEQTDFVKRLLHYGADPNVVNNNGTSVLMYAMTSASKSGNLDVLKLLISAGALVNHKDYRGNDIIYYAKKIDNRAIIDYVEDKLYSLKQ